LSLLAYCVGLASHALLFSCAGVVLNAEKRRHLAEVALQRKAAPAPSDAGASATADAPAATTSAPSPSAPAPVDHRKKGVVEPLPLRTRTPVLASSSRGNELLMSRSQHTSRAPLEVITTLLLLWIFLPSSNRPFNPSKTWRGWRAWAKLPCKSM